MSDKHGPRVRRLRDNPDELRALVQYLFFDTYWPKLVPLMPPPRYLVLETPFNRCINCFDWTRHLLTTAYENPRTKQREELQWGLCVPCAKLICAVCGRWQIHGQIIKTCKQCDRSFCREHFFNPCFFGGGHEVPA